MVASPERIGRYAVQEVIGAGAFATVYRARDERLEVDVAVKVLAENHSIDPDVRERFIEEGRRLRRVRSPHLLEVYDLGDTERAQPYLVLAWADRGDLSSRVAQARSMGQAPTPADALVVAHALADALGTLHRNHLVHRDVTPKNLLLSSLAPSTNGHARPDGLIASDEQILLADLGMSKDLARASGLTVAAGTSGFAPPEQREQAGTVDRRADIWAASALVVWMAVGEPPDDAGAWRKKLPETGWPHQVVPVLERGLAPAPGDRHPTIHDWLVALEEAFRPPAPPPPPPAQAPAPSSLRWRIVVPALAASLLAGGAVGYAVAGSSSGGGPSVRTEQLSGGRGRSVAEQHGITIKIEGPTEVTVGDRVGLRAQVEGAEAWTWVVPNGDMQTGEVLGFQAMTAGSLTVRLLATDDQGRMVEATHQVRVSEE